MNFVGIIELKRDGKELSPDQIAEVVKQFTAGALPEYQMSAFLMAVFFQGLSLEETVALTQAMRDSGEKLSFPTQGGPLVDKHSTGGVGDKVSLVLAPLLAALGFRVPMISGRSLGITGGTLDKLESIPGFRTALSSQEIVRQVQSIGCCICGQTREMVPADASLYALRDVTATVPSIPLIVASILSKKLAENISSLVLDVKFGKAAFMTSLPAARELARSLVLVGSRFNLRVEAILSRMDVPLGRAAGNWVEVREAVGCLQGEGESDLQELVLAQAATLLLLNGRASNFQQAVGMAEQKLKSGEAKLSWESMLQAQGARMKDYHALLEQPSAGSFSEDILAADEGVVTECDAAIIGQSLRDLGAGRSSKNDAVDYYAGIDSLKKPGEAVRKGQVLGRIHASSRERLAATLPRFRNAFNIGMVAPERLPLLVATDG